MDCFCFDISLRKVQHKTVKDFIFRVYSQRLVLERPLWNACEYHGVSGNIHILEFKISLFLEKETKSSPAFYHIPQKLLTIPK